jgi:hypothetical protein
MKLNGKERIGKSESHNLAAQNEHVMLDGNINRMFISNDIDDIINMYLYAKFSLNMIYHYCLQMYEERKRNEDENKSN